MIEVELPDGTVAEFPDGTARDVMRNALQKRLGNTSRADSAPEIRADPSDTSALGDAAKSFASGLPRGAAETVMLPITAHRLADQGSGYLAEKGDDLVRTILGLPPASEEKRAQARAIRDAGWSGQLDTTVNNAQDVVREYMDQNLYAPKTRAGRFAETVGEFAVPGGLPSKATKGATGVVRKGLEYGKDLLQNAIVPGVASEAAGQVTEGTALEPWARVAGAVAGNAGMAVQRASNTPEAVLRRAAGDVDAIDWDRAINLQNNSTGVQLTGPEAIAQAQGGGTALPNLQRIVEGSMDGQSRMGPFFTGRPGQVDTAVGNVLDQISPQSTAPSTLGPRASKAADAAIDGVRRDLNNQTRPLYQAAEGQLIPDGEFQKIAADPRFTAGLQRLRNNAELGADYAKYPDNSVAVVDAVTKDMAALGEAGRVAANPLYGPELAAKREAGSAGARDIARQAVPEYDAALSQQAATRRDVLDPLEQGPLGAIKQASDTTSVGNAVLPSNPLAGSQDEIADTIRRLMDQDPDVTRSVVRQNLADRYNKAATETQEGVREFSGAKFRKDIAGNAQREEVLNAVLRSIDRPDAGAAMPELLDVLQATGRRKPIGSATEFNRALNADLAAGGGLVDTFVRRPKDIVASLIQNTGDTVSRARLSRNISTLADMFIDPQSVELIRDAMGRRFPVEYGRAAALSAAQTAPIVGNAMP
ncbi:hypothetical protein [Ochrobactrum sp. C6C9]|uniref:hypothetical protein n=1 Tax=Ochrobactrum sp. C6C9 TaxID=2736662 RepID=UPI0035304B4C